MQSCLFSMSTVSYLKSRHGIHQDSGIGDNKVNVLSLHKYHSETVDKVPFSRAAAIIKYKFIVSLCGQDEPINRTVRATGSLNEDSYRKFWRQHTFGWDCFGIRTSCVLVTACPLPSPDWAMDKPRTEASC
jgi:hypothetical protein